MGKGLRLIATYENAFLIYNPRAGKLNRKGEQSLHRTIKALHAKGHGVTAVPTTGPLTAPDIARQCIAKGADLILAAGGDGTINEVVNGMVMSQVPLGVIPAGTANVLAMEMGIGSRMVRAAEQVDRLEACRVAVGQIHSGSQRRYFIMMAGAGLDALIVYNIDASMKARFGKAAYWMGGFSQLGRALPEFDVRVDGHQLRCSFALASRVRNYGGDLSIARGASLFHPTFELVLFEGAHSLPYMKYFFGVLTGRLSSMSGVSIVKAKTVHLDCASNPGIYVHVDGEFAGRLPATLEVVPDALTLLVPSSFRAANASHG